MADEKHRQLEMREAQACIEEGCVAVFAFDNPGKLNAIGPQTIEDLHAFLDHAERDGEIRAIIITGAGDRAFTAGMDVSQFVRDEKCREDAPAEKPNPFKDACDRVENLTKPVVAAINGYCIGGGVELAAACDIRLASETAVFKLPEVGLGIIPGAGGIQRVARSTSVALAKELALTARKMGAREAYEKGLVAKVVAPEELRGEAMSWALQIARQAPVAVSLAKRAANMAANGQRDEADAFEREALAITEASEDAAEGSRSFFEKRPPEFKGR